MRSQDNTTGKKRQAGKKGGLVTFERYGREHMRTIGKRGFDAMVKKHWNGDRAAAVRRLVELGLMASDPVPENGAWQYPRREGEPW